MMKLTCEMVKSDGKMRARVTAQYSAEDPPYIDCIPLDSARRRGQFAREVAKRTGGNNAEEIERELLRIADEQAHARPVESPKDQRDPPELTEDERKLAEEYLRAPSLFDNIAADIGGVGVEGERESSLTIYLVLSSRLLPNPLKAVVQGPSSAGKTFLVEKVSELFPEEALFQATSLSDNAWYYLDEGAVRHKAVILGEREQSNKPDRVDARRVWRELVASNRVSRVVTVKDPSTGGLTTRTVTVEGPCAFIETTTTEALLEEDASRMLPLRPCESREQTRKIIERAAYDAAGHAVSPTDRQVIVGRHHAVQRLLAEHTGEEIVIPYAPQIAIPADQVLARRVYRQVLALIRAVALLRMFQKKSSPRLEADLTDYETAYPLIQPLMERQLNVISDVDRDAFQKLQDAGHEVFTSSEVGEMLGISGRHARRRLWRLYDAGVISETDASRKNRREYVLSGKPLSASEQCLTTPSALREAVEEREAVQAEGEYGSDSQDGMSDGT